MSNCSLTPWQKLHFREKKKIYSIKPANLLQILPDNWIIFLKKNFAKVNEPSSLIKRRLTCFGREKDFFWREKDNLAGKILEKNCQF
jgi:hypothetical protein